MYNVLVRKLLSRKFLSSLCLVSECIIRNLACSTVSNDMHPRPVDGIEDFYCVADRGSCELGGELVRCSHSGAHSWPFFYNNDGPFFAQLAWRWFKVRGLSQPFG